MLEYKGWGSTRLQLVVIVWLITCLLLITGYIKEAVWENVTMGGVFAYILSEAVTKGITAAKSYAENKKEKDSG